jgi:hypothetical protein
MAYEEYDYYNEPSSGSLKESLYNILHGLKDPQKLREAGTSLKSALQLTPNVTESLGRGGVAQAIGTSGDLRDLSNTINSYLPKGVRNFTRAAEFLANPYLTAIQQTAPTTEETLDFVPRVSAPYEGYKQHETLGEYIAPASAYFGVKGLKAVKDLPIGATIQDVSKIPLTPKETEILASQIDELGFHSPLENAILGIKQPKGTGDQFLKQLERTPGVKTEELDVTGVKQYLLDHPTVTKQELLDYMGTGRLKLEQKVLSKSNVGDVEDYQLRGGEVYHDDDYIRSMADDLHYHMKNDDVIRSQEREALLEADPERYADYDTNPYSQARLEEDIDGVLYENAKQQANDMYYENPISHYYDDLGYDIYGNDDMGYLFKDPSGGFLDIGGRNGTYDLSDAEAALREYHFEQGNLDYGYDVPKYEDYTLPGGYSNYREVLTTLPQKKPAFNSQITFKNDAAVDDILTDMSADGFENMDYGRLNDSNIVEFKGSIPSNIEELIRRNGGNITVGREKAGQTYQSSHFDEPNILAHTRLNDRIINGKKTLMVEEIQSDWHQAGRKKGYDTPEVRQNIAKERQRLLDQKDYYTKLAEPYAAEGKDAPPEVVEGWTIAANKLQELQKVEDNMSNAVPNAPYKKNWHELMMKQILNEAVEGGYEGIAFTTGKQQAARYSLSKQISKVNFSEAGVLRAYDKDGKMVISKKLDSPDQIEDYIGKEPAKKLMEQELKSTYIGEKESGEKIAHGNPNMFNARELAGVDLDVGGEGMKGFYDKILPEFINKYTKKWGMAVRKANTKASLQGEQVHYVDITDAAKKDIKEKGQPLFSGIGLAAPPLLMDEEDN